jgi:hypothetical protein
MMTVTPLQAQPTAFTYQGHLKNNGSPANGDFTMTFKLFDALAAGTQQGATLTFDGAGGNPPQVNVDKGLFTVSLDYGVTPFVANQSRWLEIAVSGTTLTPRQPLNAVPFALNTRGINVNAAGQIGIGTSNPTAKLEVGGTPAVDGIKFPDGTLQKTAAIGGGSSPWSLNGSSAYYNAGNVGIGTNTPASKLDISAIGNGAEVLRLTTERPWIFSQSGTGSTTRLRMAPATGLKNFDITGPLGGPVATFFSDETNPAVGIGTASPLSRLDIAATGAGAELLRFSTERPWIFRQTLNGPSTGLELYSTSGLKNFQVTAIGGTPVATFIADDANPRMGIGNSAPVSKLDIVGQDGLTITGFQPFMTLRDSNSGNIRARIQNAFADIHFYTESSFAGGIPNLTIGNNGNVGIGIASPAAKLDVNGTTRTKVLQITGADLAEKFPISGGKVEPGMVMEIDLINAGKLRISSGAYNQRVAGVVSGANDFPAGAILGHLPGNEDAPPIALSGRVWTYCDATASAIAPGDLLTTSATPGHAMKAINRERSHGAIIGKAMSNLAVGKKGLVLVLVNLQ